MGTEISIVVDRSADVIAAIDDMKKEHVLVGVPAEKTPRDAAEAKASGHDIGNAALAYIHNYGCPARNIPARPFMEPGVESVKEKIEERMVAGARASLNGKSDGVKTALNGAGIVASVGIKKKIVAGPFIPLGASTLAARKRRGFSGTKPLIETGQMLNSITYVIRRK